MSCTLFHSSHCLDVSAQPPKSLIIMCPASAGAGAAGHESARASVPAVRAANSSRLPKSVHARYNHEAGPYQQHADSGASSRGSGASRTGGSSRGTHSKQAWQGAAAAQNTAGPRGPSPEAQVNRLICSADSCQGLLQLLASHRGPLNEVRAHVWLWGSSLATCCVQLATMLRTATMHYWQPYSGAHCKLGHLAHHRFMHSRNSPVYHHRR